MKIKALAAAGMLSVAALCVVNPLARADGEAPRIMLVLDASGSMKDPDPSGVTKMEAAKSALTNSLEAIPEGAEVGLRVYGAGNDGNGADGACTDSQAVHPVGPLDKAGLTSQIQGFQPRGDTPIAYSLGEAAKDLGDKGKRHIILVSDGEETCDPDPCGAVRKIAEQGIDLQVDIVGFAVGDKARQQLTCMAEVGGGSYYDAADAPALNQALTVLGTRTARPFTVSGTPVTGTETPENAPVLIAGQYTDVSVSSATADTTRFYKIKRQQSNSTIRVNVLSRQAGTGLFESAAASSWYFKLRTPDEQVCDGGGSFQLDSGLEGVVQSRTVSAVPDAPRGAAVTPNPCSEAGELSFAIERSKKADAQNPIEIRVIEEATPANLAALPQGVTDVPKDNSAQLTSPASGEPQPVVGGASFNDALEVAAGTYSTEVIPGEKVFFKTRIDYGQTGLFAQDNLHLRQHVSGALTPSDQIHVFSDLYGPDLSPMDSESGSNTYQLGADKAPQAVRPRILQTPEVRYRNRWDSPKMQEGIGFSMDGFYYYAVGVGGADFLKGQPAKIDFSIAVTGEASQPAPASSAPATPAAQPAQDAPNQPPQAPTPPQQTNPLEGKMPWIYGGAAGIAALTVGLAVGLRKRR